MKCETPARASISSREPAPIQKPSATERTLPTRSLMTRSPEERWVSSCLRTRGSYPCAVRLLVTGGSGYLGSELVRQARAAGLDVAAPPHRELDVRDAPAVERAVRGREAVVHT